MGERKSQKTIQGRCFFPLPLEGVRSVKGTCIFPSLIGDGNDPRWEWRANTPLKSQKKKYNCFKPKLRSPPAQLLLLRRGERRTSFPPGTEFSRIFCDIFVCCFLLLLLPRRPPPATLSTVSVMTCDPRGQPITALLFQRMRGLCLAGPRKEI